MQTCSALKHVQGVSFPPLKKQSKMAAATCRFLWNWHLAVYISYIIFSCMHFVCRIISSRPFPARIERRTRSSWIGPIMRHFVCIYASKGNGAFSVSKFDGPNSTRDRHPSLETRRTYVLKSGRMTKREKRWRRKTACYMSAWKSEVWPLMWNPPRIFLTWWSCCHFLVFTRFCFILCFWDTGFVSHYSIRKIGQPRFVAVLT